MKATSLFRKPWWLTVMVGIATASICEAQTTYTVTNSSEFAFAVDGPGGPVSSIPAGATYTFQVNTSTTGGVDICTDNNDTYYAGASAQGVNNGTVTVTIPATGYPATLYFFSPVYRFWTAVAITPPQITYNVTNSAQFAFAVSGPDGPVTSLAPGATYTFLVNVTTTLGVDICTDNNDTYYAGASAQGVNNGTVTVTIPATGYPPALYFFSPLYRFYTEVTIAAPPPPPPTMIINASVSTNVTLTYTGGTNTFPLTLQFTSNLVTGTWASVPNFTNAWGTNADGSFNGTNTIVLPRLDAICGPDVFLRIAQATNN